MLGERLVSLGIKEPKLLEKQLDSSSRYIRSTRLIDFFPYNHDSEEGALALLLSIENGTNCYFVLPISTLLIIGNIMLLDAGFHDHF